MLRALIIASALFALAPSSVVDGQNVAEGGRAKMMTAAEYSVLLDRISRDLIDWEATLQRVDPGKGNVSYSVGTEIEGFKRFGLMEISTAKTEVLQQRSKRTIYGELQLAGTIDGVEASLEQLAFLGSFNDRSQESVNIEGSEVNGVQIPLKSDGMERLRLLESSPCAARLKP